MNILKKIFIVYLSFLLITNNYAFATGSDIDGKFIKNGSIDLTTKVKNVLPPANGGFSGIYTDLSGKPVIPSLVSQLTNDLNFMTPSIFNTSFVAKLTDDLSEGTNNLYWTIARFNTQFNLKTTNNLSEGTNNLYFTTLRATSNFNTNFSTKTKADLGLGNVDNVTDANKPISTATQNALNTINSTTSGLNTRLNTAEINITNNSTSIALKANSSDLATVAISGLYSDLSGKPTIPANQVNSDWNSSSGLSRILNKPSIPTKTSDLTNDSGFINSNAVNSVNTLTGNVVLNTDNISQGTSNLYYSNSLFNSSFGTKSTDNLTEGITNFYWTTARFNNAFSAKSTTDLNEGTNKYYTDAKVLNAPLTSLNTSSGSVITSSDTVLTALGKTQNQISSNSLNIATNSTNINSNTTNISTNTTNISNNTTAINGKLTASNNLSDLTNLSLAKSNLSLVKADVGLGNNDNTSDASKNSAAVTLTNKRVVGANSISINSLGSGLLKSSTGLTLLVYPPSGAYVQSSAKDSLGNLYVTEGNNNRISKYDSFGNFISYFITVGNGQLAQIAIDSLDNIIVTDNNSNFIRKYNASGTLLFSIAVSSCYGTAVDSSNNIYVSSTTGFVKKYDSSGTLISNLISSGLSSPFNIAVDSSNNLFVADYGNNAIKKRTSAGTITTFISGLSNPRGVYTDSSGNVYVADTGNFNVKKYDSFGSLLQTFSTNITNPQGVFVDTSNNIFISDATGGLKKYDNATAGTILAGATLNDVSAPILPYDFNAQNLNNVKYLTVGTTTNNNKFVVGQNTLGTGLAYTSSGSPTVVGIGSKFTDTFKAGDTINFFGNIFTILTVNSDTSLTLTSNAPSSYSSTGVAYTVVAKTALTVKGNGDVITNNLSDLNGNKFLSFTPITSSVNYLDIKNAVTTTNPTISVLGSDINAGINLVTKGTGTVNINGVPISSSSSKTVIFPMLTGGNAFGTASSYAVSGAVPETINIQVVNMDSANYQPTLTIPNDFTSIVNAKMALLIRQYTGATISFSIHTYRNSGNHIGQLSLTALNNVSFSIPYDASTSPNDAGDLKTVDISSALAGISANDIIILKFANTTNFDTKTGLINISMTYN